MQHAIGINTLMIDAFFLSDYGLTSPSSASEEDDLVAAKSDVTVEEHRDVLPDPSTPHEVYVDEDETTFPPVKKQKHEVEREEHEEQVHHTGTIDAPPEADGRSSPGSPPPLHYSTNHTSSHHAPNHTPTSANVPPRGLIYHFPACSSNVPCVRMHQAPGMNSLRMNHHTTHNGGFYHHPGLPVPQPPGLPPVPSAHSTGPTPPVKTIDLLQRLFPEQNRHVLELILQACDGDIVQTIECILPAHERARRSSKGQPPCTCQDINCIYNRVNQERTGSAFSPIGAPRLGLHAKPNGCSIPGNLKVGDINRDPSRPVRIPGATNLPESETIPPVYIVNTSPSDSPDSRVSSEEQAEASDTRTKLCHSCGRRSSNSDNFCSSCGKKL